MGNIANTSAIDKELYPLVSAQLAKNLSKYKAMIGKFIEKRNKDLYSPIVGERIMYGKEDEDELFASLGIDAKTVDTVISHTYYYQIANFNPRAAKNPVVVLCMCIIKYFFNKNMKKELELAMVYLSFSGSFYPSIHYGSFPTTTPAPHIMEYVINTQLNDKYNIRSTGSVIGAVRNINDVWITTYADILKKSMSDERYVYLIQQLHVRIKSFMKNIATVYYQAYNDGAANYLTYDSDMADEDTLRIADNDSLKAEKCANVAMEFINNNDVDYKYCKLSADSNVKTEEVKSIIETIVKNKDNLDEMLELCRIIISMYYAQSKTKDVRDIDFITYTLRAKPNSKDKNELRRRQIIEKWLDENSPAYRKRKSRALTKISYNKAVLTYFTLVIQQANK